MRLEQRLSRSTAREKQARRELLALERETGSSATPLQG